MQQLNSLPSVASLKMEIEIAAFRGFEPVGFRIMHSTWTSLVVNSSARRLTGEVTSLLGSCIKFNRFSEFCTENNACAADTM